MNRRETIAVIVVSKGKTLTWLDDCRIPYQSEQDIEGAKYGYVGCMGLDRRNYQQGTRKTESTNKYYVKEPDQKGRFPANLLVSDDVLNDGSNHKTGDIKPYVNGGDNLYQKFYTHRKVGTMHTNTHKGDSGSYSRYFSLDTWYKKQPKLKKKENILCY